MEECGRPKDPPDPLDTLLAQKAALLNAIAGGVSSIETPQLGRVEFPAIDQLIVALNLINGQIAALQGGVTRTQPVIALRGLWPACGYSEGGIWK